MSHEPQDDDATLREELVAYLDGELGLEQSRRVEQRAAVEPDARRILEEFDRTWHLLDELQAPTTNDDFTRTTLEMVALAANDDAEKMKAEAPRRRWRARLWTAAGLVAAAAIGFLLVWKLAPDPNAPLFNDLQLLENYDQLREIDSIEFLRELNKTGLFAKDADAAAPAPLLHAAETVAQARKRFEAMTADQQEDLFNSEKQFHGDLKAEERERIHKLHAAILNDPDRDKLAAVMYWYCKWFDELLPWRKGELRKMEPTRRVAEIQKLLTMPKAIGDEFRLDQKDKQAVAKWMHDYIAAHEHNLPFAVAVPPGPRDREGNPPRVPREGPGGPPEPTPGGFAKLSPAEMQQRAVREVFYRGWQRGDPGFRLAPEDVSSLKSRLSPEIRKRLNARKLNEQLQIIAGWLRETASAKRDERLADFFESLPPPVRDHLMSLPGDEMYNELGWMYMPWQRHPHGGPPGSAGFHWMGPPGTQDSPAGRERKAGANALPPRSSASKPSERP